MSSSLRWTPVDDLYCWKRWRFDEFTYSLLLYGRVYRYLDFSFSRVTINDWGPETKRVVSLFGAGILFSYVLICLRCEDILVSIARMWSWYACNLFGSKFRFLFYWITVLSCRMKLFSSTRLFATTFVIYRQKLTSFASDIG